MQTPYVGGMRGEVLHPKNVIFANPTEKDEQKQKYIIIASVEPVDSVKALAKKNKTKNWENIKPDNALDDAEFDNLNVCTVLTKYSRKMVKLYGKNQLNIVLFKKQHTGNLARIK